MTTKNTQLPLKFDWQKLPSNPNLRQKARALRKSGNLSEVLLWQQIKNKKLLGLDFDRQKIIDNYIVDFFCRNLGLIIEIDGSSHDFKEDYDIKRSSYLKGLGLTAIHILDLDVKKNLDGVLISLENRINEVMNGNL